jgi:hypothetical protein
MPDASPTDSEDPHDPGSAPLRPSWFLCLTVIVACLAATVSGWGLTRLAMSEPLPSSMHSTAGTDPFTVSAQGPENSREAVRAAADLVDAASSFHITFALGDAGLLPESTASPTEDVAVAAGSTIPVALPDSAMGRGHAVYDAEANPSFEHYVTDVDGGEVYRYEVDGQYMMTADSGISGLLLLDPPSAADRYLCSRAFGSARLREVLNSSSDLAFAGWEEVRLAWPGMGGGHASYRYTGTFTALRAGFDDGSNTLRAVENAEFELWIDLRGYPRRFDYRSPDGRSERYEFHGFS